MVHGWVVSDLSIYLGALGFVSWSYSILEWLLVTLFWSPIYKTGPRVLREEHQVPILISPIQVGHTDETRNGIYKMVSTDTILFRNKNMLFSFRLHTPFPVRGTIKLSPQTITIEGRIPLGPIAFILCFLCFIVIDLRHITITMMIPEVFAIGVVLALFVVGAFVEVSRARKIIEDTLEGLSLKRMAT